MPEIKNKSFDGKGHTSWEKRISKMELGSAKELMPGNACISVNAGPNTN